MEWGKEEGWKKEEEEEEKEKKYPMEIYAIIRKSEGPKW